MNALADRDRQLELQRAYDAYLTASPQPGYVPLSQRDMAFEARPATARNRAEDYLYSLFGRDGMGATNAAMGAIDFTVGDMPFAIADGRYGDAAISALTDLGVNAVGGLGLKALSKGGRRLYDRLDRIPR